MNTFNPADTTGGHTLKPNLAACLKCHNGVDKLSPVVASINAKLTELGNLLATRKVFTSTYSAVNTHDKQNRPGVEIR